MKKKRILVKDDKKVFFKMFKRKITKENDLSENVFFWDNDEESRDFDSLIFVVYNELDIINFSKLYKSGVNVIFCIFNKSLFSKLFFLQNEYNLYLLDGSQKGSDIMRDLKVFLKGGDLNSQLLETGAVWGDFYSNEFYRIFKSF